MAAERSGRADSGRSGSGRSRAGRGRAARADPGERPGGRLRFEPLTRETWKDLARLFGPRGACGGCWCMVWRRGRREWEAGKDGGNRRALKRLVDRGEVLGVLAYRGDEPVGWCSVAPRERFPFLARSRVLAPVDELPHDEGGVWSVTCLFVARSARRQGVGVGLLRAAVDRARAGGARTVEGYPVEPYSAQVPAAFAWTGLPAAFESAGFREVARRSRSRPVFRRNLRARRSAR